MTDAKSNYGTIIKGNGSTLGEVTVIDPPEIMNPAVEATHQSSGGYREFVTGALVEVGEFGVTINVASPSAMIPASGIVGWVLDGAVRPFEIDFTDEDTLTLTFSAIVTNFKMNSADAQSPEVLTAELTLRPTGTPTLA